MENKETPISSAQEKFILQAISGVQKLIIYKLGARHRDSIDDLNQRIFYKVWSWKRKNPQDLTYEEWQKIINVTLQHEIAEFFSEKYRRDIQISQVDGFVKEAIFSTESVKHRLEGNATCELGSLLLIWHAAQTLSIRQRYAFMFDNPNFLIELIVTQCCSTKEIAAYFELPRAELAELLNFLPLRDEKIAILLETKINEKVPPKVVWEARARAKAKLTKVLKEQLV